MKGAEPSANKLKYFAASRFFKSQEFLSMFETECSFFTSYTPHSQRSN